MQIDGNEMYVHKNISYIICKYDSGCRLSYCTFSQLNI